MYPILECESSYSGEGGKRIAHRPCHTQHPSTMSNPAPMTSKWQTDWSKCCFCQKDKHNEDIKSPPTRYSCEQDGYKMIRPHLEYASAVWDPYTHYNTQKLEMVQRRAARYVCNRWHNTSSVTGMLSQRRANTRLCMMYRVAHTPVGDPWMPWLTFAQRTTRGSHAWKYFPISTSHDAYKLSFLPHTIIAWNQLPSIIIDAPSLGAFRSRLITSQP